MVVRILGVYFLLGSVCQCSVIMEKGVLTYPDDKQMCRLFSEFWFVCCATGVFEKSISLYSSGGAEIVF